MGVMLSILATCVGFLEFLTFFTNLQQRAQIPQHSPNDLPRIKERHLAELKKEREKVLTRRWQHEENLASTSVADNQQYELYDYDSLPPCPHRHHHRLPESVSNSPPHKLRHNLKQLYVSKIESGWLQKPTASNTSSTQILPNSSISDYSTPGPSNANVQIREPQSQFTITSSVENADYEQIPPPRALNIVHESFIDNASVPDRPPIFSITTHVSNSSQDDDNRHDEEIKQNGILESDEIIYKKFAIPSRTSRLPPSTEDVLPSIPSISLEEESEISSLTSSESTFSLTENETEEEAPVRCHSPYPPDEITVIHHPYTSNLLQDPSMSFSEEEENAWSSENITPENIGSNFTNQQFWTNLSVDKPTKKKTRRSKSKSKSPIFKRSNKNSFNKNKEANVPSSSSSTPSTEQDVEVSRLSTCSFNNQIVDQNYWRRSPSPFEQIMNSENELLPQDYLGLHPYHSHADRDQNEFTYAMQQGINTMPGTLDVSASPNTDLKDDGSECYSQSSLHYHHNVINPEFTESRTEEQTAESQSSFNSQIEITNPDNIEVPLTNNENIIQNIDCETRILVQSETLNSGEIQAAPTVPTIHTENLGSGINYVGETNDSNLLIIEPNSLSSPNLNEMEGNLTLVDNVRNELSEIDNLPPNENVVNLFHCTILYDRDCRKVEDPQNCNIVSETIQKFANSQNCDISKNNIVNFISNEINSQSNGALISLDSIQNTADLNQNIINSQNDTEQITIHLNGKEVNSQNCMEQHILDLTQNNKDQITQQDSELISENSQNNTELITLDSTQKESDETELISEDINTKILNSQNNTEQITLNSTQEDPELSRKDINPNEINSQNNKEQITLDSTPNDSELRSEDINQKELNSQYRTEQINTEEITLDSIQKELECSFSLEEELSSVDINQKELNYQDNKQQITLHSTPKDSEFRSININQKELNFQNNLVQITTNTTQNDPELSFENLNQMGKSPELNFTTEINPTELKEQVTLDSTPKDLELRSENINQNDPKLKSEDINQKELNSLNNMKQITLDSSKTDLKLSPDINQEELNFQNNMDSIQRNLELSSKDITQKDFSSQNITEQINFDSTEEIECINQKKFNSQGQGNLDLIGNNTDQNNVNVVNINSSSLQITIQNENVKSNPLSSIVNQQVKLPLDVVSTDNVEICSTLPANAIMSENVDVCESPSLNTLKTVGENDKITQENTTQIKYEMENVSVLENEKSQFNGCKSLAQKEEELCVQIVTTTESQANFQVDESKIMNDKNKDTVKEGHGGIPPISVLPSEQFFVYGVVEYHEKSESPKGEVTPKETIEEKKPVESQNLPIYPENKHLDLVANDAPEDLKPKEIKTKIDDVINPEPQLKGDMDIIPEKTPQDDLCKEECSVNSTPQFKMQIEKDEDSDRLPTQTVLNETTNEKPKENESHSNLLTEVLGLSYTEPEADSSSSSESSKQTMIEVTPNSAKPIATNLENVPESSEGGQADPSIEMRRKELLKEEEKPKTDLPEPFWLIFSGEYTKAMNKDWHGQHFCCWQCDESLTGQRYVLRDDHPYCVSCYESVFANSCEKCSKIIGIDSKDLSYKDKHWHEACFLCTTCGESLVDKQFGSKADRIYCGRCYDEKFASRCDGCGQIFRAGTKKMEYKTRQWHEKCFCCVVCKSAIGTQSFIPREQEIYCAKCYEEKYATRCIKCNKVITSGGVTYKNEPWHRECFTCTHCQTSLAGARFTSRDDKPYCAECFGELFAKRCFACSKPITGIGGTKFISFEDRHWHNDCFFCASCQTSLVGRGFITDGDDIICPECAKQKLM